MVSLVLMIMGQPKHHRLFPEALYHDKEQGVPLSEELYGNGIVRDGHD
jgi:hypothetical protein